MQSNLNYANTARERELLHRMRNTEFERILRGHVNISESPLAVDGVINRASFSQDVFDALILSRSRIQRGF